MSLWDRLGERLDDLVGELGADPALQQTLARARKSFGEADYPETERTLSAVLREGVELPRAWTLLGLSQLKQGKPEAARGSLERAVAQRPDDVSTRVALAETLLMLGDTDAVLAHCRSLLRGGRADRPTLSQIYALAGHAWLIRSEADHAVRELRKASAAAPKQDLALAGLLGRAYYLQRNLHAARQQLQRAASVDPPDTEVLRCLVQILLELGQAEDSRLAALRLVEARPESVDARCLHAQTLLQLGQPAQARESLLRALERSPRHVEVHVLLAKTHASVGDLEPALEQLKIARDLAGDPPAELVRQTLQLRLEGWTGPPFPSEALEAIGADAQCLLRLVPNDGIGLAAAALARLPEEREEALRLAERALARQETYAGRLVRGMALGESGAAEEARAQLRRALRLSPSAPAARQQLLRLAGRQVDADESALPASDLRAALVRLERFVASHEPLRDLSLRASQVAQDYDRPLLVAVMGEFNSGKSTFVNALIGETIAPMGVTPTTATINLLKYGAQKQARVVWGDDREQLVPWADLGQFLDRLTHEEAARVRLVELLYPAEELLRVNVVDTPGLNSMIPAHEVTAREMLQHADAVVWLFSADQAGKQTEQQALEWIRRLRLKTVGVINKVDRLSEDDLQRVMAHLQGGFGALLEGILPVSAREALSAVAQNQPELLQSSRFPRLRAFLEERLFVHSRRLKREVTQRRAQALADDAWRRLDGGVEQLRLMEQRLEGIHTAEKTRFATLAGAERGHLLHAAEQLYRRAAEEVLDFVKPRRWALGEHRTEPPDRDFVIDLLEDEFAQACEASRRRAFAELEQARDEWLDQLGGPAADGTLSEVEAALRALVSARQQQLTQQVYARFGAFVRGYLRGGWVDRFFEQRLPRIDLDADAIYQVLIAEPVELDAELLAPMAEWASGTGEALGQLLRERAEDAALARWELESCWLEPLLVLRRAFARDQDGGNIPT